MEPLGYDAIRLGHLGDLREYGAFPVLLFRLRPPTRNGLPGWLLFSHGDSFEGRRAHGPMLSETDSGCQRMPRSSRGSATCPSPLAQSFLGLIARMTTGFAST